jgi:hypothetical protein
MGILEWLFREEPKTLRPRCGYFWLIDWAHGEAVAAEPIRKCHKDGWIVYDGFPSCAHGTEVANSLKVFAGRYADFSDPFRIKGHDGSVVFMGWFTGEIGKFWSAPLDDYAYPEHGLTDIEYKQNGTWVKIVETSGTAERN